MIDPQDEDFINRVVQLVIENRGDDWQGATPPPLFTDTVAHIMAIAILSVVHPRHVANGLVVATTIGPVQEVVDACLARVLEMQEAQTNA